MLQSPVQCNGGPEHIVSLSRMVCDLINSEKKIHGKEWADSLSVHDSDLWLSAGCILEWVGLPLLARGSF